MSDAPTSPDPIDILRSRINDERLHLHIEIAERYFLRGDIAAADAEYGLAITNRAPHVLEPYTMFLARTERFAEAKELIEFRITTKGNQARRLPTLFGIDLEAIYAMLPDVPTPRVAGPLYRHLANCALLADLPEAADDAFREAVKAQDNMASDQWLRYHVAKGDAYILIPELEAILSGNPRNWSAQQELLRLFVIFDLQDKAEAFVANNEHTRLAYGKVLVKYGKPRLAVQQFDLCHDLRASDAETAAHAYERVGQLERAEEMYIASTSPTNDYRKLAKFLLRTGRAQAVADQIQTEIEHDDYSRVIALAELHFVAGNWVAAKHCWKLAYEHHGEAIWYAHVLHEMGLYEEELSLLLERVTKGESGLERDYSELCKLTGRTAEHERAERFLDDQDMMESPVRVTYVDAERIRESAKPGMAPDDVEAHIDQLCDVYDKQISLGDNGWRQKIEICAARNDPEGVRATAHLSYALSGFIFDGGQFAYHYPEICGDLAEQSVKIGSPYNAGMASSFLLIDDRPRAQWATDIAVQIDGAYAAGIAGTAWSIRKSFDIALPLLEQSLDGHYGNWRSLADAYEESGFAELAIDLYRIGAIESEIGGREELAVAYLRLGEYAKAAPAIRRAAPDANWQDLFRRRVTYDGTYKNVIAAMIGGNEAARACVEAISFASQHDLPAARNFSLAL